MKKRIQLKRTQTTDEGNKEGTSVEKDNQMNENEDEEEVEAIFFEEETNDLIVNPKVGEYWKVKNGVHSLFVIITNDSPLEVKYFESTVRGSYHCLNDTIYEVFSEDLDQKVPPPKVTQKGRRTYYSFQ